MSEYYAEKICPVCGKVFYPSYLMNWGWLTPKNVPVCSYTCQRKSENNPKSISKPKRKRSAVRIVETGRMFESVDECAVFFNTTRQSIYNSLNLRGGKYGEFHLERVKV